MNKWLNKNHLGDCLDLMSKLPAGSVDLVVTSPPYNLRRSTGGGMWNGSGGLWSTASLLKGYAGGDSDDMPREQYVAWQRRCLTEMLRLLPDTGAIFYNHKWRVQDGLLQDQQEIVRGFGVRQIIIWQRAGGINFNLSYFLPTYEVIYLIPKSKKFRLAKSGDPKSPKRACGVGDIWYVPQERSPHPAPFPVEIPRRCIEATDAKIILDPFMGSGSTAIAAEMLGRKWVGMEKVQTYADMADARLKTWRSNPRENVVQELEGRLRAVEAEARRQSARTQAAREEILSQLRKTRGVGKPKCSRLGSCR